MPLQNRIKELKSQPLPPTFQGVSKERIAEVLAAMDRRSKDMVDAVFALLDDVTPSLFSTATEGTRFCHGATTQHIAWHIGSLQRNLGKLDREGRDYWIKPLRDIAAVEPVYLQPATGAFVLGHPVAKSPNSAYRLAEEFRRIVTSEEGEWQPLLKAWIAEDATRARLEEQAMLTALARRAVDTKHSDLIAACETHYVPRFLPGFEIIYVDDGDGDRITGAQARSLQNAGIALTLADAMPDILLWERETDSLWVIEAVTSDGEVDLHKLLQLRNLAERAKKKSIGFTTAYQTWRSAAARQSKHKNLPLGTYLWIMEDPSKHFHALGPNRS